MTERMSNVDDAAVYSGRDMTEMVLRLAHEIRNPLATIKSSVQLIRRLGMSAETAAPHLESTLNQVERIHRTIREIEAFVSLQPSSARAVQVEDAVARVFESLQDQADQAEVGLTLSGGPSVRVAIDPQQLHIVLTKLIENALRFSSAGSSVQVSWEKLESMVRVDVDDQGCGVAKEHARHILRPFYSTSSQGIGLGLNVAHRICELAGGCLEWENRVQAGCRFTVYLKEV